MSYGTPIDGCHWCASATTSLRRASGISSASAACTQHRVDAAPTCPVHVGVPEPCPTCGAHIAAGL